MHDLRNKLLPLKLNLEMVAAELGLSHLSEQSRLEAILQYQRDYGLTLRSDEPLDSNTQLTGYDIQEWYEDDGTVTRLAIENDVHRITTRGETITLGPAYLTGPTELTFELFSIGEAEFYPVDHDGIYIIPLSCDAEDVYIDKEDLIDFLDQAGAEIPAYADPASEYYAPELALAIELHTALRVKKGGNPEQSLRDRVSRWLIRHHSERSSSDAQITRLAAVIGNGKRIP